MGARDSAVSTLIQRWGVIDGCLAVEGTLLTQLAEQIGRPFYVHARSAISARLAELRSALPPDLALLYAVKANPQAELLSYLQPHVDGFDIASGGELERALASGMPGSRISFAGPAKTDAELARAAGAGALIVLESAGEAQRLSRAAAQTQDGPPRVALRINPPFELAAEARMGGGPRKFGIDSEEAPRVLDQIARLGLSFEGFHFYVGSQCLDAAAIAQMQRAALDTATRLAACAPAPVRLLNLGGGLGIPLFADQLPLDLALLGTSMRMLADETHTRLPEARLTLELGRYIVGETGLYVCRVLDRKRSRGKTFLIVDGGMHHHWHASAALEGRRDRHFPLAIANRIEREADEIVTVAGPLCAPQDVFAQDVCLPRAEPGDLLVVFQSGAYGASASPSGFLGHPPAAELLL